jgi:hypothetical protein
VPQIHYFGGVGGMVEKAEQCSTFGRIGPKVKEGRWGGGGR